MLQWTPEQDGHPLVQSSENLTQTITIVFDDNINFIVIETSHNKTSIQMQQLSCEGAELQLVHAHSLATDYIACLCRLSQVQLNCCQYPGSSINHVGFSLNHVGLRVHSMLAICFSYYEKPTYV